MCFIRLLWGLSVIMWKEHLAQCPTQGLHWLSAVVILLENLGSDSLYSLVPGNRGSSWFWERCPVARPVICKVSSLSFSRKTPCKSPLGICYHLFQGWVGDLSSGSAAAFWFLPKLWLTRFTDLVVSSSSWSQCYSFPNHQLKKLQLRQNFNCTNPQ